METKPPCPDCVELRAQRDELLEIAKKVLHMVRNAGYGGRGNIGVEKQHERRLLKAIARCEGKAVQP